MSRAVKNAALFMPNCKISKGVADPFKRDKLFLSFTSLFKGEIPFELHREKTGLCICKNKDADQLRGDREADQLLCFPYTNGTIPLLSKSEISSL